MEVKKTKLSAIIIAKNEEEKLPDCLESVKDFEEIVFIDTGSTDKTIDIAKKYTSNIHVTAIGSYSDWRNEGLKNSHGEWIFYIDADERVTPLLRREINAVISDNPDFNAYAVPRRNIILGREMKHGGWWPDYVKRLYRRKSLKKWVGELHEEPLYYGNLSHLNNPLIHIKHDNIQEMLIKTNKWSETEAKLLYDSGHPQMKWWRFFRIMLTEGWYRLIVLRGFLDGNEGVIYALYQMWSRFVTYVKLWEMQMKASDSKAKI